MGGSAGGGKSAGGGAFAADDGFVVRSLLAAPGWSAASAAPPAIQMATVPRAWYRMVDSPVRAIRFFRAGVMPVPVLVYSPPSAVSSAQVGEPLHQIRYD